MSSSNATSTRSAAQPVKANTLRNPTFIKATTKTISPPTAPPGKAEATKAINIYKAIATMYGYAKG